MSSEQRLSRLGLSHLQDQPEKLKEKLAELAKEGELEEAEIERQLAELRAKKSQEPKK